MNKERLLNVAKALRESKNPDMFNMNAYGSYCGTPACAFGHYAARRDLQDTFEFKPEKGPYTCVFLISNHEESITHANKAVLDHFGITGAEAARLFGCESEAEECIDENALSETLFLCKSAGSANEAADWIERFVERNS